MNWWTPIDFIWLKKKIKYIEIVIACRFGVVHTRRFSEMYGPSTKCWNKGGRQSYQIPTIMERTAQISRCWHREDVSFPLVSLSRFVLLSTFFFEKTYYYSLSLYLSLLFFLCVCIHRSRCHQESVSGFGSWSRDQTPRHSSDVTWWFHTQKESESVASLSHSSSCIALSRPSLQWNGQGGWNSGWKDKGQVAIWEVHIVHLEYWHNITHKLRCGEGMFFRKWP